MVASWSRRMVCTQARRRTRSSRCSPPRSTWYPRRVSCPHKTACTPAQEEACTRCSRRSRPSCTGSPRVASLLHRSPGIVAGLQAGAGHSIRCNRCSHSRCRATPTGRSSSCRRDCTSQTPLLRAAAKQGGALPDRLCCSKCRSLGDSVLPSVFIDRLGRMRFFSALGILFLCTVLVPVRASPCLKKERKQKCQIVPCIK